jgi:hypothetical protein
MTIQDVSTLRDTIRMTIMKQIADSRSVPVESVDGMNLPSAT